MVLGRHSAEQAFLVDEWNLDDSFPLHLLAVHIEIELARIEIDDGRVGTSHQGMVDIRDDRLTSVGKHTHELLVGAEGLAKLEVHVGLETSLDIRDHGRVMVVVVPGP